MILGMSLVAVRHPAHFHWQLFWNGIVYTRYTWDINNPSRTTGSGLDSFLFDFEEQILVWDALTMKGHVTNITRSLPKFVLSHPRFVLFTGTSAVPEMVMWAHYLRCRSCWVLIIQFQFYRFKAQRLGIIQKTIVWTDGLKSSSTCILANWRQCKMSRVYIMPNTDLALDWLLITLTDCYLISVENSVWVDWGLVSANKASTKAEKRKNVYVKI